MNPQDASQGTPQQQVIERLRTAVNVLVTVSNNPSVDQLAAVIGFTLLLNKMGKHATAVFSGDVPSTIEFLKPEATIEKNTDSLRDFIVSLDKAKADKLRYKVEENVVKIFITPYRTSLSEKDLNFSQGDFNVDAVVALGVSEREQLDQAIVAHGRILHDATVITISAGTQGSSIGAIYWQDQGASSLCEMLVSVGDTLEPGLLDNQIATAYLTGIVAQTGRFRNEKTTPKIMTLAAQLMAAGANQQLIASSLEQATEVPIKADAPAAATDEPAQAQASPDGELTIKHDAEPEPAPAPVPQEAAQEPEQTPAEPAAEQPSPEANDEPEAEQPPAQIHIDEHGNLMPPSEAQEPASQRHILQPLPAAPMSADDMPSSAAHPLTGLPLDDGMNEQNIDPLGVTQPSSQIRTHGQSTLPPEPPTGQAPGNLFSPAPVIPGLAPAADEPPVYTPGPELPMPVPSPETQAEPTPQPQDVPVQSTLPPDTEPAEILTLPPALDTDTLRSIEKTFNSPHITKDPTSTLNEIEEAVASPHVTPGAPPIVDSARDAVDNAIAAAPYDTDHPEPMQALNAAPLEDSLSTLAPQSTLPPEQSSQPSADAGQNLTYMDPSPTLSTLPPDSQQQVPVVVHPTAELVAAGHFEQAPPPVPPPLTPVS